MIVLALLLAATAPVTLYEESFEVAKLRSRAIEIPLHQRPATVVCQFSVAGGKPGVRAVLMTADEVQNFRDEKPVRFLESTDYLQKGELRHRVIRPGEYRLLIDNRHSKESPTTVNVKLFLEFDENQTFEPRTLSTGQRYRVILASLALFALVAGWSGNRLLGAVQLRQRD